MMAVLFYFYMAISLLLWVAIWHFKVEAKGQLTDDEKEVFKFMDKRPFTFNLIFILTSPLLLTVSLLLGVMMFINEARKNDS